MFRNLLRPLFALLAVTAMLAVVAVDADARSRGSFGSRGSRTFSAPPSTATSPRGANQFDRTMTQPGRPGSPTIGRAAAAPTTGGFFNRPGLLGGLAGGFLGAGLFGLLFGKGLAGGLGGLASFLGLLLQLGIIAIIGMFIWNWWQRRNQPAYASNSGSDQGMPDAPRPTNMGLLSGLSGAFGGGSTQQTQGPPVEIKPEDFNAFERLLSEVQTAYGAEDLNALRSRVTPEMLSYYSDELAHNTSMGDHNQISDIKLLQGDLSEAWSEDNDEYATVAMRYSLNDRIIERSSGRLVEQLPSEATELWTFMRARGGNWILSAIQQSDEDEK